MKNIIYILTLTLLTACSSLSDTEVKSKVSYQLNGVKEFFHPRVISVEKVNESDDLVQYKWTAEYTWLIGIRGQRVKGSGFIMLYKNGDIADFHIDFGSTKTIK